MQPRLMRSRNEAIIAGVCGGLAEYFAIDPVTGIAIPFGEKDRRPVEGEQLPVT